MGWDPYFRYFQWGVWGFCVFLCAVVFYVMMESWVFSFRVLLVPFLIVAIMMGVGATLVCPAIYAYSQLLRRQSIGVITVITLFFGWGPTIGHVILVWGYYVIPSFHWLQYGVMGPYAFLYEGHLVSFYAWIGWGVMTVGWGLVFLLTRHIFEEQGFSISTGILFIIQGFIQLILLGITGWFNPILVLLAIACSFGIIVIHRTAMPSNNTY